MISQQSHRIDQELGPDPAPHPLPTPHPRRQRTQTATERYRMTMRPKPASLSWLTPLTVRGLPSRKANSPRCWWSRRYCSRARSKAATASPSSRRERTDSQRAEFGRGPVAHWAGPGKRPIVQGGPEQDGNEYPRLIGDLFLSEVLGDDAESVVQRRPEFAFHDCSP